jgi:heptosyltransferase I
MSAREGTPRILIVRLSALGDVVMASGLIASLRSVWPQAHLAWLVEPPAAPLLQGHPDLDQLIVWPRPHWKALWRERRWGELRLAFRTLRATLREARFDIALDAQGLLKSGLWCWASGAPRRISLLGREGSRWLATERLDPVKPDAAPLGHEYRALARHLGAADAAFQPRPALTVEARAAARAALERGGVGMRPYAVLAPFTTRPQKHWFDDDWVALARDLADGGLAPVLLGGPDDRAAAQRIAAREPRIVDLAGALKLDQSVAAIAGARLLVGVDTGLTHVGSAFNVPTVALFGSTRPYLDACAAATRVLYTPLPCSPCGRHPTCGARFDCMRAHTPATVGEAARAVMRLVPVR